jgi:hypothetical protein
MRSWSSAVWRSKARHRVAVGPRLMPNGHEPASCWSSGPRRRCGGSSWNASARACGRGARWRAGPRSSAPPRGRPSPRAFAIVARTDGATGLIVSAQRVDRLGALQGDGVAAGATVIGAVGGDGRDRLALGDPRQQAGRHGRIAHAAASDLDSADLRGRLVDGELHLAPNAQLRPAVLAREPFVGVSAPRTEP